MGFIRHLKSAVEMTDFFYSTQLLRFNKEGEYRTFTGGFLSIGIIVVIIIGFANMIGETLNKSRLTTSFKIIKNPDPTHTTLVADPNKMFMFGIEIWRHNLNDNKRYFDVISNLMIKNAGWGSS